MFEFLAMMDNYEQRKVARYPAGDNDNWLVDTCAVNDSTEPFETAVKHPRYNDGKMVIVELYPSREAAKTGHAKWVKTMSAQKLPATLRDVSSAGIAQLCDVFDNKKWRTIKARKGAKSRLPQLPRKHFHRKKKKRAANNES